MPWKSSPPLSLNTRHGRQNQCRRLSLISHSWLSALAIAALTVSACPCTETVYGAALDAVVHVELGRRRTWWGFKSPQGHTLIQRYDSTVKSKS